jgi:tRNA (guanine-N7-)-methyltransferase
MNFGLISACHDVGRDFWLAGTACERVVIEIGPGSCGYLLEAARRNPGTLYAGIEIYHSALERVRQKHTLLANVRLIEGDGGWMVRSLLAPASVDAFHVYFPDPWWKKRHHKRRLFQPELCEALARALTPGGTVYVVTDVVPVFREIVENMEAAGFRAEPWDRDDTDPACSSYERKYRQQGRTFEKAKFKKNGDRYI